MKRTYCTYRSYPDDDWTDEAIGYPAYQQPEEGRMKNAADIDAQAQRQARKVDAAREARTAAVVAAAQRIGGAGNLFTPNDLAAEVGCSAAQVGFALHESGVARFVQRSSRYSPDGKERRYWRLSTVEAQP